MNHEWISSFPCVFFMFWWGEPQLLHLLSVGFWGQLPSPPSSSKRSRALCQALAFSHALKALAQQMMLGARCWWLCCKHLGSDRKKPSKWMKLSWVDWDDWIFAWEFTGIDGVKWVKTWVKQYGYFFVGLIGMIKKKWGNFEVWANYIFKNIVFHGMTEASDSCSGLKKCLIWDGSKHWRARSSKADVPERGLGHSEAVKYRIFGDDHPFNQSVARILVWVPLGSCLTLKSGWRLRQP